MPNETQLADLISWLEADEAKSREWRARRMNQLLEAFQIPECSVPSYGELSMHAFNEVRLAYIHGLYLATVLLTLACVEQEVAGQLYADGWDEAKDVSLHDLLQESYERGILSDAELESFQHLRDIRNSYAHFRPLSHRSSLLNRSTGQRELSGDVIKADATQAIEALGSFFSRQWGMK